MCLAYPPEEFPKTLRRIAAGKVDAAGLITGEVGLDGVPDAFAALADPAEHIKILVRPGAREASLLRPRSS
ncbi:hypothetical protein AB0C77_09995 [Streptomyces sp. NPDC048629]|uniref:hypothetical protein n=1 Tax=Streptomyces sp. NPDC048629 TaxID=3154824 RepID=UPI0034286C92